MIGTITLTGGLLAAGVMAYKRSTNPPTGGSKDDGTRPGQRSLLQRLDDWRTKASEQTENLRAAADAALWDGDQRVRFGLQTSVLSLGLTTAGILLAVPFTYASIPTLIFMGVPPAQEAYDKLSVEGRLSLALVETAALGICLAGGYLWIGSLGFSVYYLGRTLLVERNPTRAAPQVTQPLPKTAFLYQGESKIEVPVASLQKGDRISLESGDLSPVDGLIVEGSAWLKAAALAYQTSEVCKGVGDRICALDVVVVGHIHVQVQPA